MAPANNTAATATLISSFPYDFTQTDINDAGVNYDVWYKFVAPVGATMMSIWGYSGNNTVGYRPTLKPYDEEASFSPINGISADNKPIQLGVVAGEDYWIKWEKNLNDAGPNQLRVRVSVFNVQTILTGSIVVNDDASGFPVAILSNTTDYTSLNYFPDFPSGEGGDYLTDGTMCFESRVDGFVKIYNSSFVLQSTSPVITGLNHIIWVRRNGAANKFWLGTKTASTTATVRTLLADGTLGSAINFTVSSGINIISICVNSDDSILYYTESGTSNVPVKRRSLPSGSALSDLAVGIVNEYPTDMLYLSDDTILVAYDHLTVPGSKVRRYNTSGALLNTYDAGFNSLAAARLTWALDTPNSFWVYTHINSTGDALFQNFKVNDESLISDVKHAIYQEAKYFPQNTATPLALYGVSDSCPMLILAAGAVPPEDDSNGIYMQDTRTSTGGSSRTNDKLFDSDSSTVEVKIPDPFAIIYPSGD